MLDLPASARGTHIGTTTFPGVLNTTSVLVRQSHLWEPEQPGFRSWKGSELPDTTPAQHSWFWEQGKFHLTQSCFFHTHSRGHSVRQSKVTARVQTDMIQLSFPYYIHKQPSPPVKNSLVKCSKDTWKTPRKFLRRSRPQQHCTARRSLQRAAILPTLGMAGPYSTLTPGSLV